MSRQDKKQQNRRRIAEAAEQIIREQGVERMTMRQLADVAGVALKTPYNLFGSKTAVLISLMGEAMDYLIADLGQSADGSVLTGFGSSLDQIREFFLSDEAYYRVIFWEIMTSDQPEARALAHTQIIDLITARLEQAIEGGELSAEANPNVLGRQLGLNFLALLGIWASGHVTISEVMDQTKAVWASLLSKDATPAAAEDVAELLAAATAGVRNNMP